MPGLLYRIALGCTLGTALVACGSQSVPSPSFDGRGAIVLVSGRDDHGLVVNHQVPLYRDPDGTEPVADIADGQFARVLEVRGTWLQLESLDATPVRGWVDDFFLRERAVLDGRQQVRLLDARASHGQLQIEVAPVTDPSAIPTWAPASHLTEVLAPAE